MKVDIVIDGVKYEMPDGLFHDGWPRVRACDTCIFGDRECANLCLRVYEHKLGRK